jgi:hypothetical protein
LKRAIIKASSHDCPVTCDLQSVYSCAPQQECFLSFLRVIMNFCLKNDSENGEFPPMRCVLFQQRAACYLLCRFQVPAAQYFSQWLGHDTPY